MKKENQSRLPSVPHEKKRAQPHLIRLLNNPKLRCGSFSLLLTVLAVVLVLFVNYLASSLENAYALSADFSYNELTHQSETTKAVVDSLTRDVHLYYLHSKATETADSALLSGDNLLELVKRYAASSPRITYSQEDIVKNPTFKDRFKDMLSENEISSDCLIVYCEEQNRARVLSASDYISYSYNMETGYYQPSGFTYEKKITEAILYVAQDELPTLQILTGHGELSETDTSVLERQLVSNNYLVKRVTLGSSEALDPTAPLLVLCPQLDFSSQELQTLLNFAKQGGSFFFVNQYADPLDLPNYNALLLSYGFVPLEGLCVAKTTDTDSYYSDSPAILMPYMQQTSATQALIDKSRDILLLAGARAYDIAGSLDSSLAVEPLLKTGQAYLRQYLDGASNIDQQAGDVEGVFNLALISDWTQADGTHSRAFIIGNSSVFTDDWVYANTYASEFLLQMLQTLQGRQTINLSILPKSAARANISLGSLALPTILVLLLPVLVLLAALCILLPRKNM